MTGAIDRPQTAEEIDSSVLTIDRNSLDTAVIEQPNLFYTYSELAAKVRDELEGAKGELDRIAAETANELRKTAEKTGAKITEARISEQVTIAEAFLNASVLVREAKLASDRANNMKEALSQRANMLKLLVELYASNYFSIGAVRTGVSNEMLNAKAGAGRAAMAAKRAERGASG